MGEITISPREREALRAVEVDELNGVIANAMRDETFDATYRLRLGDCGPHVGSALHRFDSALLDHRKARAPQKRTDTADRLRRAGSDLAFAVSQMKSRLRREETDEQLFRIDDEILRPYRFSKRLSVRVHYCWRRTIKDEWTHGSIVVSHDFTERRDYARPVSGRKPNAAKREADLQDDLHDAWEHLMRLTLYSIRDFFRAGRDGNEIPPTFLAISDPHSQCLNNRSVDFWLEQY